MASLSYYMRQISRITGRSDPTELATIEDSMRDDVFHSTLDWLSAAEFERGAREAVALLIASGEIRPIISEE
jgi:hypothetical protein